MAKIAVKPIVLNDVVLIIGADNYEATVNRVTLTPTTPTATWKGMTPGSDVALVGEPTWTLDIQYAQDYETEKSVSNYALAKRGVPVDVSVRPKAGGKGYKVNAVPVPGPIGGDLGEANAAVAAAQWPINGQPTALAAA